MEGDGAGNKDGLPEGVTKSDAEKGKAMCEKTGEFRRLFNLPAIDHVIQDYHCGFWRGLPYGWWQVGKARSTPVLFV